MAERQSCLWIEAQAGAGSDIERAAVDAINLAARTGCGVSTNFNGISLRITARSTAEEVVAEYWGGFGTWRDANRKPDEPTDEGEATAPDATMLGVLMNVEAYLRDRCRDRHPLDMGPEDELWRSVRDAIAKATGEPTP